jgi:hypothetical protein
MTWIYLNLSFMQSSLISAGGEGRIAVVVDAGSLLVVGWAS